MGLESAGAMEKWRRDWGIHCVGEGARLRRLAGGLAALLVLSDDVVGWGGDSGMSGSRVRLRERGAVGGEAVEVDVLGT